MPVFDTYPELTSPDDEDLIGVCKDVSETDPAAQTKYTKFLTYFTWLLSKRINTSIDGLKVIWNSANSISVGVGECYAENGDFIKPTSTLTLSSLSLSNSVWYHIYVYKNGGSPEMEAVTTAPVVWQGDAYSKTGDTSRRYVGSVKTDGSGNILKFIHDIKTNSIFYMKFASNASPFRCLSAGTAATAAAVSVSGAIPVTSTLPLVKFTNLADGIFRTSDDNAVGNTQNTVTLLAGNTNPQAAFLYHPTDASQQVWYKFDSSPTTGGGYIDVLGYIYKR